MKMKTGGIRIKRFLGIGVFLLGFLFLDAAVSAADSEGFYADVFRLTPFGEPEPELTEFSVGIDSYDPDFSELANPLLVRAQDSSYWTAVQSNPIYVAQSTAGVSAADQAPRLGGASSSVPSASTSVAPPIDAGTLTPSSGTVAPPCPTDSNPDFFSQPVQTMKRFCEGTSLSYTFIPSKKETGLGLSDFDFNFRFNFPCKCLPHQGSDSVSGYWYLVPNFGLQLWDVPDNPYHEFAKQTFKASMGFGCEPQFTEDFGADLFVELGVASSFKKIGSKAFYVRGRGLGTLRINENITAVGGVVYYGRNHYKLLPSGGVLWVPNEKNEWRLVFPDPCLTHYIANLNETKWWGYLQGNIYGGRWYVPDYYGSKNIDYNDYRVGIGLKFQCAKGCNGFFEVGGAFGRELYADHEAYFKPKSSVYLKTGLFF